MKRSLSGHYLTVSTVDEPVKVFVPPPLPPDPAIDWSLKLFRLFDEAHRAIGRLEGVGELLPETPLFLYSYVRKEVVLSSMIEGTRSSLSDLLAFELDQMPGVPLDDVQEVSNYVTAMNHGLTRLDEGFPLSLRLIRNVHEKLLSKGREATQTPGEFRRTQNVSRFSTPSDDYRHTTPYKTAGLTVLHPILSISVRRCSKAVSSG